MNLFSLCGCVQDQLTDVPFTDIDYHVFTDAALALHEQNNENQTTMKSYSPKFTCNLSLQSIIGMDFKSICW